MVKGSGRVTINGKETDLFIGDTIFINKKDNTGYKQFKSNISFYRSTNRILFW